VRTKAKSSQEPDYRNAGLSVKRRVKDLLSRMTLKEKVDVTSTGSRAGDEIVQMYIGDKASSVPRPVKELKGFERVTLAPGETKTIALAITPDRLAFHDIDKAYVVEPGEFELMVGNSSRVKTCRKWFCG
jgi:hypothetical protein